MYTQEPITVAIIEDQELMRNVLEMSLKTYPQIKFVASSPNYNLGLDALLAHKPDVALVDIVLPDGDGIGLVREFFKIFPKKMGNRTKIIFLTSMEEKEYIYAGFEAGGAGYCVKQSAISVDWLIKAIERVHEGETWIDPKIASLILSMAIKGENIVQIKGESEKHYAECLKENPLTERELQVLNLLVEGLQNKDIAEKLFIAEGTVKTHVRSILDKLGANDRTQAAVRSLRLQIIS